MRKVTMILGLDTTTLNQIQQLLKILQNSKK